MDANLLVSPTRAGRSVTPTSTIGSSSRIDKTPRDTWPLLWTRSRPVGETVEDIPRQSYHEGPKSSRGAVLGDTLAYGMQCSSQGGYGGVGMRTRGMLEQDMSGGNEKRKTAYEERRGDAEFEMSMGEGRERLESTGD